MTSAPVAPMFRPPEGDLILGNAGPRGLEVFDADSLESVGQLLPRRAAPIGFLIDAPRASRSRYVVRFARLVTTSAKLIKPGELSVR